MGERKRHRSGIEHLVPEKRIKLDFSPTYVPTYSAGDLTIHKQLHRHRERHATAHSASYIPGTRLTAIRKGLTEQSRELSRTHRGLSQSEQIYKDYQENPEYIVQLTEYFNEANPRPKPYTEEEIERDMLKRLNKHMTQRRVQEAEYKHAEKQEEKQTFLTKREYS